MDSYKNNASAQTSAPRRSIHLALAGYRVVARHRDHSQALVTLAENLRQAANRAKAFCDTLATGGNEIVSVRVEEWVGTLIEGEWRPIGPWLDGLSRRFATQSTARNARHVDQPNRSVPNTGDGVECVLLGEKTRKGGWKAKLLQHGTEGPITNTADVPESAKPSQIVTLRVGAISEDGKRIRFHWQQADNPKCR